MKSQTNVNMQSRFQYFIHFIEKGMQLTKCLCTYISVFRLYQMNTGSVLLDTQGYCTQDNITYITTRTYTKILT